MSQLAFYFDSSSCTGCKTCQVACKENHQLPVDILWRKVYAYEGGSWESNEATGWYLPVDMFGYHVSIACNHCESPACYAACAVGAITKDADTGIVYIDPETCIGCQACVPACPYGAPVFREDTGLVEKCDMCRSRVAQGKKPYCVAACPMRALDFGELDELRAKYGDGDVEIEPLPADSTSPSLVLNPHPNAEKSGSGTGHVANLPEELGAV